MLRRTFLVCCAACLAAAPGLAIAQTKFEQKLVSGEYDVRETTAVDQTLTVAGQSAPQKINATQVVHVKVGEPAGDGGVPVERSTKSMKVEIELPMGLGKFVWDSEKPDAKSDNPLAGQIIPLLKAQLESTATYSVTKGKVSAVEGVKKETQTEGADIQQTLQQDIDSFPKEGVKAGDTWERKEVSHLGQGQFLESTLVYKYEGTVDKFPTVKGSPKLEKFTVVVKDAVLGTKANAQTPYKITKSDLKVLEGTATMLFDPETGRVVETKSSLHVSGTLVINAAGMDLPAVLDLTVETSTKEIP